MILGRPIAVAALTLVAAANPPPYAVRDIGSAPGAAQTPDDAPVAAQELFKITDIDAAPTPGRGPDITPTAPEDLFKISDIENRPDFGPSR